MHTHPSPSRVASHNGGFGGGGDDAPYVFRRRVIKLLFFRREAALPSRCRGYALRYGVVTGRAGDSSEDGNREMKKVGVGVFVIRRCDGMAWCLCVRTGYKVLYICLLVCCKVSQRYYPIDSLVAVACVGSMLFDGGKVTIGALVFYGKRIVVWYVFVPLSRVRLFLSSPRASSFIPSRHF